MKRILIAVSVLVSSLLLAATAFAVVQSGNSGWRWSNPQPQGNTLISADFVGDRGYAAGAAGTLLRSDNKGSTWSSVRTGLLTDVSLVRAITADSFVFAAGCSLRRSDDGGATITRLPWTPSDDSCNPEIQSFSFPDLDNGYLMLKDGTVYKTADRGQTWALRTGVPGTAANGGSSAPGDINFLSATTGVVSAANGIYRTTDSGSSWTLVNGVSAGAVRRFTFLDATKGFAVSSGSTVLATVDGGLTYAPVVSPGGDLTGIDCESVTNCLVTQTDGKIISRTIDGGATWAAVTPSSSGVFSVTFATGSRAVAVGGSGATEVSDDSGATWTSVSVLVGGAFYSLRVTSPTTAYAFGQTGTFARTTDGGASWTKIGVSTAHNISDLAFPDATNGFALDDAGTVLRTTNSGASWQFLDIGTVSQPRAIYAKSPTQVVLVGPKGVRTSSDSGNTFSLNSNALLKKTRLDALDVAGNSLVAYGPSNVFIGDSSGKKWKVIKLPRKRRPAALDFVNAKSGYFIDQSDELWFTGNAGKKWTMVPAFRHGRTNGLL
ncbi:MAG: hypothetical protein JHC87_09200, partial [Thermoleophilaceae bacterium]|nr:hypothetical protein [Thermoleophilaceae bacterium]